MSVLMRAREVIGRPVVTWSGEAIAQVKDLVYTADGGRLRGFTLNGRGLLAGPLRQSLPWGDVAALGSAAVMVDSPERLGDRDAVFVASSPEPPVGAPDGVPATPGSPPGGRRADAGDVLGSQVLTDAGVGLGRVVDVVLQVTYGPDRRADVVGYEIEAAGGLGGSTKAGKRVLVPLPDTISVSAEHLMVPASARNFVADDLAGFGAAVLAFRAQLDGGR